MTTRFAPATARVLEDVRDERARQEAIGLEKRARGIEWRSCADPKMAGGDGTRYLVLGEEVGEVANAILERDYAMTGDLRDAYDRDLRKELVQVAAVAVAWVEAIDARRGAVVTVGPHGSDDWATSCSVHGGMRPRVGEPKIDREAAIRSAESHLEHRHGHVGIINVDDGGDR